MATDFQIKFYKGAWGLTGDNGALTLSTNNQGGIYFDTTSRTICVGGLSYGGNITDASFDNGILTISKAQGGNLTLDFTDTASASATMHVFTHMNNLIGTATEDETLTAEYAGTHYLESAQNLIAADKALDTAIYELGTRIDNLSTSNVETVTKSVDGTTGDTTLTFKGVSETGGVVEAGTRTDNIVLKKVATSGNAKDVAVETAGITATDVEGALVELANQITAGDVSIDGYKGVFTTDESIFTVSTTNGHVIGVQTTGYIGTTVNGIDLVADKVDTAGLSTEDSDLATVKTVKTYISTEIAALDVDPLVLATIAANQITIANVNETDGKIGVSGSTTINVDGTVSSENPLLTKSSLDTVIEDLDVTGYAQASVSNDEIKIYGIKEDDGKIDHNTGTDVTIKLGSNYNASSNKVALESNITDAINNLDVDTVQAVTYTEADTTTGAKLTFTGIQEENGEIKLGTGVAELQFAKVATSGTAADVAIVDSGNKYAATDVEGALLEVKNDIAALTGGMRYNGGISSSTATLNTATNDIRPGDIYLASGAFTIGTTNVEAGDMIVYKGNKSTSTVTLDASNCSIIERETDTMVTSGATLTTGQLVIGSGNKEVNISTITEANLLTAMANANSALQSIGHGTDGQYVTTTVSAKDTNNNQNVSVALTTATVTSTATTLAADTNGVLTDAAIAPIKSYVDAKVGSSVEGLYKPVTTVTGTNVQVKYEENDGIVTIGTITETYAGVASDLTVTTSTGLVKGSDIETVKTYIGTVTADLDKDQTTTDGTNVHVTYSETDGIVTINSVTEDYASVSVTTTAGQAPTMTVTNGTKLAVGSDVEKGKEYTDAKVAYEISQLGTSVTSDDAAVATVQVVEANGKITEVNVTNVSAGVSVGTTGSTPTLSATTDTGAVTGADIAKIKDYVDAKATQSAAVVDTISTVAVNSGNQTEIAQVGGQAIHTAVSFTWEEYA